MTIYRILLVFVTVLLLISCSDGGSDSPPTSNDTQLYDVTVNLSPSDGGTISPSSDSSYEEGSQVSLQANSTDAYTFSGWTGTIDTTANPVSITVDKDYNLTANFQIKSYELSIKTTGEGTVTEQILQQKTDYEHGTVVELTANPAEGWKFVEWQGDITGTNNPAQITVDAPKSVTAVFEKKSYALTINISGEGAVTEEVIQAKATDYEFGTTVELTASPAKGWQFVEWQGDLTGSQNPDQITVDTTKTVTAVFEKKTYAVNVSTSGEGSVNRSPDQTDYSYNSIVELTANPATGWQFVEWQGDLTGSLNPEQITVDTTKTVTAVFEKKAYAINVSISGEGAVSKSPDQTEYEYNSIVDLTANPAAGWRFVEWQGDIISTDNPVQVTVDTNKNITAVFENNSFKLSVNTSGDGSVTKNPDQTEYEFGTLVDLTAEPNSGWEFEKWNGDTVSTENPITISIDSAITVTAVFNNPTFAGGNGTQENPYQVSTISHLQAVNEFPSSNFIQINDIDASATSTWNGGEGFNPIGDDIVNFTGTYDGNNYEVTNLTINRDAGRTGLFGYLLNAVIKNVSLVNINVSGGNYTGGLVGWSEDSNVSNSTVSGVIIGKTGVGGLVGHNFFNAEINLSTTNVEVSGDNNVGGLVGNNWANVRKSSAVGKVNAMDVLGTGSAGGLTGNNTTLIENSFADIEVNGQEGVGGLVGNNSGKIENSYSLGSVDGTKEIGGLAGTSNNDGEITTSFSASILTGSEDIGGIIGVNGGVLNSSFWDTESTGQTNGVGRGNSDGTTGLTTSEMTGSSAKTNMSAFDFVNIWVTTSSYPGLFWE